MWISVPILGVFEAEKKVSSHLVEDIKEPAYEIPTQQILFLAVCVYSADLLSFLSCVVKLKIIPFGYVSGVCHFRIYG